MSSISFFWSRAFLASRQMLIVLFLVNALGTVYGYIWYWDQMQYTLDHHPLWRVVFVPDSPTASLFFTLSLLYLLFPQFTKSSSVLRLLRPIIEALAVVTSLKYGIWAVTMILAGAAQGDHLVWEHYMLIVSHLGMAIEGLLFVRFMVFGRLAAFFALLWLLLNDTVDYTFGVYPWLSDVLEDDLNAIQTFTIGLSVFSLLVTWFTLQFRKV
ncbi:hypothetical protein Back11_23120 [Paenibacillus baekrokdamisoli]|uniref:Uncharacterized protein n=2 Tax=Paenibacillus baekrokdamisoli TaxID=1712516 RepID=A0A3G9IQ19_9BACL|nr:DUF1405 domain-containing protein [Paenibacillus baekrokdamisoli]MBB3069679.1 putative membrane protein YpjA [Paenibacillus baekrokdamisoli]BBH20967.1 hypothetical protein Back11_23120 [Paenibacillus baekrokdamisoli]